MYETIYSETVTFLNKLHRKDSFVNKDIWFKTIINDAVWYTDSARAAGSNAVYIATYITVLVPFHDEFLSYIDWKLPGNQDGHYTMSQGDYVVRGIVTEDVTADNVVEVMKGYGEDVCYVRHHKETHDRFGAHVQLKIQGV